MVGCQTINKCICDCMMNKRYILLEGVYLELDCVTLLKALSSN